VTRDEVIDVLTVVSIADKRTVGQGDVTLWQEVMGHLDKQDALKAIVVHLRDFPNVYMSPGHVVAGVRAKNRDLVQRESDAERKAREDMLDQRPKLLAMAEKEGCFTKAIPGPEKFVRRTASANSLNVACPYCKATVGRACTNGATGQALRKLPAHPSRMEKFKAQLGETA
jgi:hypothetical protein